MIKHRILFILLIFVLSVSPVWALSFTEVASSTFSSGDANPISEGGVWAVDFAGSGSFKILSGTAQPTSVASDSGARYIGASFNANQYSRANLTMSGASNNASGIGLSICASSSARTMYRFTIDHIGTGNNAWIYRYIAGVGTKVGTEWAQTFSDGDEFTFANIGEQLFVFRNGALVKTMNDTGGGVGCASTRFPGLVHSSTTVSASADNWSGGNVFSESTRRRGF